MKIHNLEQNSEAWFNLRCRIPTSSMFSKLITSKGKRSASMAECINEKVANIIAGETLESWTGNQWTERGHEIEPLAVEYYQFQNDEYDVQEVGFITDDDLTCGCSPDRLVNKDGLLEIKCPMPKNQIDYLRKGVMPTAYFQQVQGQLMVTGRDWCDFMSYHPKLPVLIVRVKRDDVFISELIEQIKFFNTEVQKIVEEITNR